MCCVFVEGMWADGGMWGVGQRWKGCCCCYWVVDGVKGIWESRSFNGEKGAEWFRICGSLCAVDRTMFDVRTLRCDSLALRQIWKVLDPQGLLCGGQVEHGRMGLRRYRYIFTAS